MIIGEAEERKLKKERQALLAQVDAIEEYLNIPKTSDMRRFAKEKGFYEIKHLTNNKV